MVRVALRAQGVFTSKTVVLTTSGARNEELFKIRVLQLSNEEVGTSGAFNA